MNNAEIEQIISQNRIAGMLDIQFYKTNHILHLILTLLTFGFWMPIWVLVSAYNCYKRNGIRRTYKINTETNLAGWFLILLITIPVFSGVYEGYTKAQTMNSLKTSLEQFKK